MLGSKIRTLGPKSGWSADGCAAAAAPTPRTSREATTAATITRRRRTRRATDEALSKAELDGMSKNPLSLSVGLARSATLARRYQGSESARLTCKHQLP